MDVIAYQKEADISKHFYFMHFPDMKTAKYKFADSHIHHSIEMVFCMSGDMHCVVNQSEFNLKGGEILIINSLDWHFYEYVGNAECYILVISQEFMNDILFDANKEFNNHIKLNDDEFKLVSNLLSESFKKFDTLSFIAKKAFVLSLFTIFENENLFRNKEVNVSKDVCKHIICYIEDHYQEKLTIGKVAKEFGYSRNYFSYLFNKLIGETFASFLNRYRYQKALDYKKTNKDMLIEDIVTAVGFNSRETYYRYARAYR